ncbi:MAG: hypothetical protein JXB13_15070 [Phycisphaerae bacterium]|nr:hypothetical protein [Phycisphaerae bacterium]
MTAIGSILPRAVTPETRISRHGNECPHAGENAGCPVVLLATARYSLVRVFGRMAIHLDFALLVSPDGLHALMAALQWTPDLVVLDSALPGITVEQVEAGLARDARTQSIPRVCIMGSVRPAGPSSLSPLPAA